MSDDRELSALMRDAMVAEARQVSAGTALTEQLISAARAGVPEPRSGPRAWQGWVLPAAAAVLVALLASSVLIGGRLLHSVHRNPASSVGPLPRPSAPAPSTLGTTSPARSGSSNPSGPATGVPAGPVGGPVPAGFRAVDLTWISDEAGWALGTAPCANAICTSIVRTRDGGQSWVGIHAPVAELFGNHNCTDNCLTGLRFANRLVGYAYGPGALYLTTDGGDSWRKQPGNAYAIEIADGTVLRVTDQRTGGANCGIYAGCPFKVQRAELGSSSWQDLSLPSGGPSLVSLSLVRTGPLAVLTTFGHVAGGAQSARSALYVSTDDGSHWQRYADPCPARSGGNELDTRATTIGADGSISVLCSPRAPVGGQFTMTSTDSGAHFTAASASVGGTVGGTAIGAASASTLLVAADRLYRSTDGGRSWQPVGGGGPTQASYIGFESDRVGRVLGQPAQGSVGSATVWTTRDAGASWSSHTFR